MKPERRHHDMSLMDLVDPPTTEQRRAAALVLTGAAVRAGASHSELREVLEMLELTDE